MKKFKTTNEYISYNGDELFKGLFEERPEYMVFINEKTHEEYTQSFFGSVDIFKYTRGRVYFSDHSKGIIKWNSRKKQYIKHYYGTETNIGKLKEVVWMA